MVLAHWNNSLPVDLYTLFLLRANQSLFLVTTACLAEKQQIPILVFGLTWLGLKPMIYHTWGKYANRYTTDAVIFHTIF